jgi:hypothetical protein
MVFRLAVWRVAGGRVWCGLVCVLVAVGCGCGRPGSAGAEGVSCSNEQLRAEQPYGLALPDCRAYEMVSPLDKSDNGIAFSDARASESTESPAVTYFSPGSFSGSGPEARGAALVSRYLSRRESTGWSTENITPAYRTFLPQTSIPFQELLFTPTLSMGVLAIRFTSLVEGESGDPTAYINIYRAGIEAGSYQRVTDVTPPEIEIQPYEGGPTTEPHVPDPAGTSTDLAHVVFQQKASLTEGAASGRGHVYEWGDGKLSLVDVPPEGGTLEGEDSVGAPGKVLPPALDGNPWRAVSADGSRVFFTGGEKQNPGQQDPALGQLYLRENPEQPPVDESDCSVPGDACTIEVSASQRTNANGEPEPDPSGVKPAYFRDASADGSRVFFTSRSELTSDANTGPADNAANLYVCETVEVAYTQTCRLSDLTPDANPEDPDGAAVLGLVDASEDGSYVYFVANGVLSKEPNDEGETASPGDCKVEAKEAPMGEPKCNLYVEHYDGTAWEAPRFVAALAGGDYQGKPEEVNGDEQDWVGYEHEEAENPSYKDFGPGRHTARVTPDGTRLAFESERILTKFDNERAEPGECESGGDPGDRGGETGGCREVYLYDALTGKLVCASCDRSLSPGATPALPVGPAELGGQEEDHEGDALGQLSGFYLPRNLSEDGGRLFFQSPDPLVPGDSNGLLDVYEWEQDGSGACRQEDGCVLPISDVTGGHESHFMDASASGEDVFIATANQLLPSDTDTRVDVYDARVDGGFPVTAVAPVCDNADSCKPPASPQPGVFGAPASATFSGPGNTAPTIAATVTPKKKTAAEIKAEKLTKALKQCKQDKKKAKRTACEKHARKEYGAAKPRKAKKSAKERG